MRELTRAEEQVMQVLWDLKQGFVKDVLEQLPEPKPAYNTVSTIIRTLEKKGFVSYKAYGKTHEYYPLVRKNDYQKFFMKSFLNGYFGGSFQKMVSFFANEKDIDIHELEEVLKHVKKQENPRKDE